MANKSKTNKQENESWGRTILDAVIMVAVIWAAFWLLFRASFAPFSNDRVSGISMQPTFEDNDRLIASRKFQPKRNITVVLYAPKAANDQPGAVYIKRMIGLPGDTIVSKNDQIYVNGKQLPEPYLNNNYKKADNDRGMTYTNNFTVKVPKGKYFVMGDHRDVSKDSRIFGFVKRSEFIGQVKLRYWPFNKIQTY
ncbi:signal peptidase I [Lactobacillus sp. ESL0791]|uniref:signal peptidase I n=1 Tax=Lactobacillus sp. ESL0791 TaxID=2983234 RepID=UPI0023F8777F|nr:signal peptidase I [Lactobacillus sp. ESL0791]MDF7638941.1 signal peptidase I [Lactobacillus sp. ESL0791]